MNWSEFVIEDTSLRDWLIAKANVMVHTTSLFVTRTAKRSITVK